MRDTATASDRDEFEKNVQTLTFLFVQTAFRDETFK